MVTEHTHPASTLAVGDVLRRYHSPEPYDCEDESVEVITPQPDGTLYVVTDGAPGRYRYAPDTDVMTVENSERTLTPMHEVRTLAALRARHLADAEAVTRDLRAAAAEAVDIGMGKAHVASVCGVSRPTLDAWCAQERPSYDDE